MPLPPITPEQLLQHDKPAPRYTSYPTAASFTDAVGPPDYRERLQAAARRPDEALSLYVHLPFCDTKCTFCGCTMVVSRSHEKMARYTEHLLLETRQVLECLGERRQVAQLHLGGGSPNHLPADLLEAFWSELHSRIRLTPDAEVSLEIDPRVGSAAQIQGLAALGFNRISMGVQDFDPSTQALIHRRQESGDVLECFQAARESGFGGINIDLVYGLPGQDVERFLPSVEKVIELRPDRIALFSFAYVPWLRPHQKAIAQESLPTPYVKLSIYVAARQRFLDAGYEQIGMDHFALAEDELALALRTGRLRRNFQGYTVLPGSDSLGLGMSAIGDLAGAYVQNSASLQTYEAQIAAGELATYRGYLRSPEDELRRDVIHRILCGFGLDYAEVEARWELDFATHFGAELGALKALERENLVELDAQGFRATELGKLLIRVVAMPFDLHLEQMRQGATFSRSI